ncbi:ParB/RepB/Spo0J family partition protein [Streptomyces sp. NPDC060366]|uniref:ParB/RepB/Spo0J family partition protein n=1 Tax=Streptomyces sp. NPDC060366 TaxID=3347105 RepID=UPI00365124E0
MSDPLLLTLPLTQLVPTRFNPRRNFGTEEDLKAFGLILKKRQLQPAVVVSRAGYLKLWPDEEATVGDAQYVIANGERRYRASMAAGLTTLNVVHNEPVANSRADFLDAVLSENNDREDLDPIERALGIETMVIELGGADQVAAHYGKTKGWVSQQRKLLKLTTELQNLVSAGELPIRVGRDIAGLPAQEQGPAWREEVQKRQAAKALPRARTSSAPKVETAPAPAVSPTVQPARTAPESQNEGPPPSVAASPARNLVAAPEPPADEGELFTAVNQTADEQDRPPPGSESSEQDDSQEPPDLVTVGAVPWGEPQVVYYLIRKWMRPENIAALGKLIHDADS